MRVCLHVHHVSTRCTQRLDDGVGDTQLELHTVLSHRACCSLNLGPVQELPVLLTPGPTYQPPSLSF